MKQAERTQGTIVPCVRALLAMDVPSEESERERDERTAYADAGIMLLYQELRMIRAALTKKE